MKLIDPGSPGYQSDIEGLKALLRGGGLLAASEDTELNVAAIVADILTQVRTRGDVAAVELTERLDSATIEPDSVRVSTSKLEQAHREAEPAFLDLIRRAADNIRTYQEHIRHRDPAPLVRKGRKLGVRYTPIERVGVYVPGGRALYPSTVLMTVVPAQVAGVEEIVMASPPTGGAIHPMALALAHELGIREVLQLGGAVAVAAMAYGTDRIVPVQKIVGPGNAFVAEAKRQLFGKVGIDSVAGPSEVVIVADDSARAEWVAADLLAQAEHDPGASILITPSRTLAEAVARAVTTQLTTLARGDVARVALEKYGALILTDTLEKACEVASDFAAEHLQIMTRDNASACARIRHAGAIFLGEHTPVPLGDYYAGPSHVLPTSGTAKFFGPLSCNDFLKASSLIEYEAQALREDASDVEDFATREGLTAHARATHVRVE
ncbi:MAG: histidinol dehydrogenase [Myxococcales bacterium]|nr:histidinol dehydrogenase [Myxococcales bacterium]